jgi:hypothetical protein
MTSAFERLLADLSEAEVDYILVGGLAVAFCGHVRATEDLESMTTTRRVNDYAIRHLNIDGGLITLKEESLRKKDQMDVGSHFNAVS